MKTEILDLINSNNIHKACKEISKLSADELSAIKPEIEEMFTGVGINESTITIWGDKVAGYEGNGHYTLDEPDYADRFCEELIK